MSPCHVVALLPVRDPILSVSGVDDDPVRVLAPTVGDCVFPLINSTTPAAVFDPSYVAARWVHDPIGTLLDGELTNILLVNALRI